ncbi:MAG: DUF4376 domain-containing protein [Nitratireductor sp.]|uniref:DUF4376 domain-containing protein n=1 Tax=Nitratireductor sp. TaxID=1872084 RepID=UPI002632642F|nr:DUF4376 domain-containing protein [Nitratireductor sp.]MCV0350200.1 DUF4376 domain-containing protein [Nitratireductor sp.]
MNENWEILSLRGTNGYIEVVEYGCQLSHPDYPGVTDRTVGTVTISPLSEAVATRDTIVAYVKAALGEDRWQDILAFTEQQLSFLFTLEQGDSIDAGQFNEPKPITPAMVDFERDRRIALGFLFEGVHYQSRPEDRENIDGAKSLATDAVTIHNAEPGNLRWQHLVDPSLPDKDFGWIAADNSVTPMDAQTMMRFGYAALNHKQAHIFAARVLKLSDPIPADFATNEAYWP